MAVIIPFPSRRTSRPLGKVIRATPDVKRRVTNILKLVAHGAITETTACFLLEGVIPAFPEPRWLDCGSYCVLLYYLMRDGDDAPSPVVDIKGKQYSKSGSCPACNRKQPLWLLGEGNNVEVMCARCSTVYTTNERAIERGQLS